MKNTTLLLLTGFLIAACGGNPSQPGSGPAATSPETISPNAEKVVYKDAVVYAASTDFVFENEKGEQVMVRVSNLPEEQTIKFPDNMLDPDSGAEGPPGGNPALIGKPFVLIKNETGEVTEIQLVQ